MGAPNSSSSSSVTRTEPPVSGSTSVGSAANLLRTAPMARSTSLKAGRRPKGGRPSLAGVSPEHRQLTAHEVTIERVALCVDMLTLMIDDADTSMLPHQAYTALAHMQEALTALWRELRQRP